MLLIDIINSDNFNQKDYDLDVLLQELKNIRHDLLLSTIELESQIASCDLASK